MGYYQSDRLLKNGIYHLVGLVIFVLQAESLVL